MKKHGNLKGLLRPPHARLFAKYVQPHLSEKAKVKHRQFNWLFPPPGPIYTQELFALALQPNLLPQLQTEFSEAYQADPDTTLELMVKTRAGLKPSSKAKCVQMYITAFPKALAEKDDTIAHSVQQAFGIGVRSPITGKDVENARRKLPSRPYLRIKSKAVLSQVNPKESRNP